MELDGEMFQELLRQPIQGCCLVFWFAVCSFVSLFGG